MNIGRDRKRNILVISDLHLGEGLRHALREGRVVAAVEAQNHEHLVRLERELSAFLIHYTAERSGGLPWRLVINGDMVDFMSIMLMPRPPSGEFLPAVVTQSMLEGDMWGAAEVFGLGTGAEESRLKLEQVIAHHGAFFRLLAKFVAAGNDLSIVLGNHDMEFCHEEVQRTFVSRLVELGGDGRIAERVQFCPWFYYEEDLIYIEHGHQYDEYCSFDYQLCPAASSGGLALSFAHTGMRFFGNLVPSYDQRTAERWGLFDYLRWGLSLGVRPMIWLTYMYGLLAWKASAIGALLSHPKEDEVRRQRHRAQLRALSQTYRIQEERIMALDALRVAPAVRRVGKIFSALFLDRVILGMATLLALFGVALLVPGLGKLAGVLVVVGVAVILNRVFEGYRGETSPAALRRVTRAIHKIVRAPLIVFGHSHEPERIELDEGAVYYNTGTWMEGGGSHVGTHLVVLNSEPGQGPHVHVEMRRWQDGTPVRLEL